MLIKVLSDTHNDHDNIFSNYDMDCDILIHCGDAGIKGNYSELRNFLEAFVKQPAKYKLFVPGNHDKAMFKQNDLQALCKEYGIHCLIDSYIELCGFKILTACHTPYFKLGESLASNEGEREAYKHLEGFTDIDILLTHCPPENILSTNLEGYNCGSNVLRQHVDRIKPKIHFFGHIHEHGGENMIVDGTTFVNVACKNREYLTVRGPTEVLYNK